MLACQYARVANGFIICAQEPMIGFLTLDGEFVETKQRDAMKFIAVREDEPMSLQHDRS